MTYLLDTNACVAVLRDRASNVARRLALETPSRVGVCSVVKAELYYGPSKASKARRRSPSSICFSGLSVVIPLMIKPPMSQDIREATLFRRARAWQAEIYHEGEIHHDRSFPRAGPRPP